jgi:hypothetical protein
MRSFVSSTVSDVIPEWAGGIPADAPPRPGEAGYDKFMHDLKSELAAPKGGQAKDGKPAADEKAAPKSSGQ